MGEPYDPNDVTIPQVSAIPNRGRPIKAGAPRSRTAAEAVAQADAKYRIRAARGMRFGGNITIIFGVTRLLRRSAWASYNQTFSFTRPDGSRFSMSLEALVWFGAIAVGAIVSLVGFILLRRAVARARANPTTAGVIGESMSGAVERWFF